MNFGRDKNKIITYAPEALRSFKLTCYEWIDNLNFTLDPKEFIPNADEYISIAKKRFLEEGWDGHGRIELMWIPPFMFKGNMPDPYMGLVIWHVKQLEDGTSWILSPIELP